MLHALRIHALMAAPVPSPPKPPWVLQRVAGAGGRGPGGSWPAAPVPELEGQGAGCDGGWGVPRLGEGDDGQGGHP